MSDRISAGTKSRGLSGVHALGLVVLGGIVYLGVTGGSDADRAKAASRNGQVNAISACQKAIARAARNPSAAVIPYRKGTAVKDGWVFDWGLGDGLLLQNGYGGVLESSARCAFIDGQVAELLVDGNSII